MAGKNYDLIRVVSASKKEYERALRQALPGGVSGGPNAFILSKGNAKISLIIEEQPDKAIALMRLPCIKVFWSFHEGTSQEITELVDKLDLSMMRGGG